MKVESGKRKAGQAPCLSLLMVVALSVFSLTALADVSVVATVDQRRVTFGESIALTVAVQGAQSGTQPMIPAVDGLAFSGPSTQQSMSWINGQTSQSVNYVYQVTPTRVGEFTIPAVELTIAGKSYRTEPITLSVEKGAVDADLSRTLFGRVQFEARQVYLGQTSPLNVMLFARQDLPIKGVSGFQYQADGLSYKFLPNLKSGTKVINGETFNVLIIEGAVSPAQSGTLRFGPSVLKAQIRVQKRRNQTPFDEPMFDQFFGNVEMREMPVTIDEFPIEVLPLPEQGKPANFAGAVGQWNLEVSAKPTEVAVGDPITLTVKISGDGNIDTVPPLKLEAVDAFKAYDPTAKTTKNELGTQGERVMQQVLIAKDTNAKQLPAVSLAYFDPVAKQYKTAGQGPFKLLVKAGTGGQTTVVSGSPKARQKEKLGQDIVYLKGDLGPAVAMPFCARPAFWAFNFAPVISLAGLMVWKRRTDKLRSDVAYARRSRAAKRARKQLASAASYDHIQRALQNYLGDRLNVPASGITAAIVDEHLIPRGVDGELAAELRKCFETCDTARFAGASAGETDVRGLKTKVEQLIDELESNIF